MARLINHRSDSTTPGRALSARSAANTPIPFNGSALPSSPNGSDKENSGRAATHKSANGMPPPNRLPTPSTDGRIGPRSAKRRRTNEASSSTNGTVHGDQEEEAGIGPSQRDLPNSIKYYDPSQNEGERRDVKRKARALEREFNENREDYLKNNNAGLRRTIEEANNIFAGVKQTSDATLDSRLMVSVSDLAHKKSAQLVLGDSSTGIDVDEFVSKCIFFMKRDNNAAPSATHRRRARDEDDEDDDQDDVFDWEYLGKHACFPNNIRPAVPGFLLGPLSVQKRIRAPTQRRARQQRDTAGREARPEELTREDMTTTENNAVSTVCKRIKSRLIKHCKRAEAAIQASVDDTTTEEATEAIMRQHRLTETGGPSLFDFVINPHSFGQTVENLFYASFLIKEGEVGIEPDNEGLPTLVLSGETIEESRKKKQGKHQAVFGLDYATWEKLKEAYEIREPLIPNREEQAQTQMGNRGWYA